jgi:hypothetical protein
MAETGPNDGKGNKSTGSDASLGILGAGMKAPQANPDAAAPGTWLGVPNTGAKGSPVKPGLGNDPQHPNQGG